MAFEHSPDVDQAARPRKVTDRRGGHIEPENAKPRPSTGGRRDAYGSPGPTVEAQAPRKSGDPMSHDLVNKQVPAMVTRPTPPANTMTNPLK